ncbi:MAG: PorT family protein, partial [Spirochaetaceae bacterium]|nr:PorT family protein [Spirochaetaceae bacterium]
MKKILLFTLCALIAAASFAEEPDAAPPAEPEAEPERIDWFASWQPEKRWFIGIYGGYANNTLYTGGAEHIEYFKTYEAGHGWTIALPVRFFVFNWLAVQVEPVFLTKNYTVRQTGEYAGELNLYDEYTNSFVEFPLMLHVELPLPHTDVSFFANGGGYL